MKLSETGGYTRREAFAGKTLSVSYDRNGYTDVRKGVFAEVRRISTD